MKECIKCSIKFSTPMDKCPLCNGNLSGDGSTAQHVYPKITMHNSITVSAEKFSENLKENIENSIEKRNKNKMEKGLFWRIISFQWIRRLC